MPEFDAQTILFVLGVGLLTTAAAVWDLRTRRIPNRLTVPVFFAGLFYQILFNGWGRPGLADAGLAFAFGFGTLFVLWIIGGGGGGDVKLMGALSVWLGFRMTFWVVALSTLFVTLGTLAVIGWAIATQGMATAKQKLALGQPMSPEPTPADAPPAPRRRVMAFALPVTLATWVVVIWNLRQTV